jgi:hypothetical protein
VRVDTRVLDDTDVVVVIVVSDRVLVATAVLVTVDVFGALAVVALRVTVVVAPCGIRQLHASVMAASGRRRRFGSVSSMQLVAGSMHTGAPQLGIGALAPTPRLPPKIPRPPPPRMGPRSMKADDVVVVTRAVVVVLVVAVVAVVLVLLRC